MSALRRPTHVYVEAQRCIRCELCEQIAPGMLADDDPVEADEMTMDAMAACPTGAIRWWEREEPR